MDLISLLGGPPPAPPAESPPGRGANRARIVLLLDYLPLGPERAMLAAAAARTNARILEGRDLFPGFPAGVDLFDAVRHAGAYADAVVLRHPLRGAARAAAAASPVPVLSAGDGAGEDPLFALADLAALSDRLGGLEKKSVALCGDLRRNRRVHSVAAGLLAAGARVVLVPAKGAAPEEEFLDALAGRHGYHPVRFEARSMSSLLDMVDTWLLTPDLEHQLSLFADVVATDDRERRLVRGQVREIHALWVAEPRNDIGEPPDDPARRSSLSWRPADGRAFASPDRPGEAPVNPAEDAPAEVRAVAAALSAAFAGRERGAPIPKDAYEGPEGTRCANSACIACREPARVLPAFTLTRTDPVLIACLYCGRRKKAEYVGSRRERRYHRFGSPAARRILRRNTVFFESAEEAAAAGFAPSRSPSP